MKAKSLITLAVVCLMALGGYASTKQFVISARFASYSNHWCYVRGGMTEPYRCPTGYYVQLCVSGGSAANDLAAPTTNTGSIVAGNAWTNYLPADCQEYQVGTVRMGNGTVAYIYPTSNGNVNANIGNADTSRRGWMRCFSAREIIDAAYYGDTASRTAERTLNNTTAVGGWVEEIRMITINPAYRGMRVSNPVQTPIMSGGLYLMTGTVNTVAGGAPNVLGDADVMVWWRTNSSDATGWKALQNLGVVNGAFTGYYAGGSEVIVGMPASGTTLPNSEAAQGPIAVAPVPEPAMALAGLAIAFLLKKR